jgi:succinoglycan biosynthesis protein ExoM
MNSKVESLQLAVTVCICTYRRTSLVSTLRSVVSQIMTNETAYRIVVIDNDDKRSAEPLIVNFRATTALDLEYLHAPGQNISVARNAGLTACRTSWLAFVDDDETVAADWLERLMAHREGTAAVFGPCEAIYCERTPKWIRLGDYHSNRITLRRGVIETGYTSNVLINIDFVRAHKLQFDEALGRTGGEDTMFFNAIRRCGGRLAYAPNAFSYELVPETRTTAKWVAARRYRVGQSYSMLQQKSDIRKYWLIPLSAPIKIAFCLVAAVLAVRPSLTMWWWMRAVFHYGMLSYRLNGKIYQEYRFPDRADISNPTLSATRAPIAKNAAADTLE